MAVKSSWRGHDILFINQSWVYADNSQPVSENPKRHCGYCGKRPTEKDHDFCIRDLPAVKNACCGHGVIDEAYVQFFDKSDLRGLHALRFFRNHKRGPNEKP